MESSLQTGNKTRSFSLQNGDIFISSQPIEKRSIQSEKISMSRFEFNVTVLQSGTLV